MRFYFLLERPNPTKDRPLALTAEVADMSALTSIVAAFNFGILWAGTAAQFHIIDVRTKPARGFNYEKLS